MHVYIENIGTHEERTDHQGMAAHPSLERKDSLSDPAGRAAASSRASCRRRLSATRCSRPPTTSPRKPRSSSPEQLTLKCAEVVRDRRQASRGRRRVARLPHHAQGMGSTSCWTAGTVDSSERQTAISTATRLSTRSATSSRRAGSSFSRTRPFSPAVCKGTMRRCFRLKDNFDDQKAYLTDSGQPQSVYC